MEVTMHRFVLAEFNTHRVFSRNSASSRAIPFKKMCERVSLNLAYPVHWGTEQKGMQSGDELAPTDINMCKLLWESARVTATQHATKLFNRGLHKSVVNRLLEPFMWHTVIVTSTEWENFFAQRYHKDAQPEIRVAAEAMLKAYNESTPKTLKFGEWHTPLITPADQLDIEVFSTMARNADLATTSGENLIVELRNRISMARCARSSYMTQHGIRDVEEDLNLFERLVGSMHPSPFEHVASPCAHMDQIYKFIDEGDSATFDLRCRQWGNFFGWHQYRKSIVGENRTFDFKLDSGD